MTQYFGVWTHRSYRTVSLRVLSLTVTSLPLVLPPLRRMTSLVISPPLVSTQQRMVWRSLGSLLVRASTGGYGYSVTLTVLRSTSLRQRVARVASTVFPT